jgi:hypothetical protein
MQNLIKNALLLSAALSTTFSVLAQKTPVNNATCTSKKWSLKGTELTLKEGGEPCSEQVIMLYKPIAKSKDGGQGFSVLADIAKLASYDKNEKFFINGKPFSGMLIGVQKKARKIDTLLEVNFYLGERVGQSFVRTKEGVLVAIAGIEPIIKPIDPVVPVDDRHNNSVKKPVIYLYPTTAQTVNVQVDFKGELTHTYPKYPTQADAKGWSVLAQADGTLLDEKTNKTYYNLFWEGESAYQYSLNTGFVVAGAEVADFLDDALAKLGLNRREANEFITFWLPEMEKNAYNLVHFSTKEYSEQAVLNVNPKPDTEIRVFMVYQPLKSPIAVTPQTLSAPARKGFTLVEWGGMLQPQPNF